MNQISTIDFMNSALSIREAQLSLTASNLANQDTPNFKAKGISFKESLMNISNDNSVQLRKSDKMHLNGVNGSDKFEIKYVNSWNSRADGNTVNAHLEKIKFSEYQVQYQAALELSKKSHNSMINAFKDNK